MKKLSIKQLVIQANDLITRINSKDLLRLIIRSRQEILFEGEVKSVSSINEIGVFDILPQHANFISIIKETIVIIKPNDEKQNFPVKTGLIKVWENEAKIFLDVLEPVKI